MNPFTWLARLQRAIVRLLEDTTGVDRPPFDTGELNELHELLDDHEKP